MILGIVLLQIRFDMTEKPPGFLYRSVRQQPIVKQKTRLFCGEVRVDLFDEIVRVHPMHDTGPVSYTHLVVLNDFSASTGG